MNDYNENVLQFVFAHNRTPSILGNQMALVPRAIEY